MADANIIEDLPLLRWRDLETPPYELVTFEFANDLSPRRIPYLDGEVHDFTGRKSFPMTARLFFLNTLGEARQMFPDLWNDWQQNLDGEVGELVHPVLGPLQARVQGAKGEIRATTRAGVIVDVTWVETITNPAFGDFLSVLNSDPATLAAAADAAWQSFPTVAFNAPQGSIFGATPTLADSWATIRGQLFSPSPSTILVLQQLLDIIDSLVVQVDALGLNEAWAAVDNLIAFSVSVQDYAKQVERLVRPTAREVVRFDTTLDAFAANKGNDLNQLMGLNLNLLRSPIVPRGATVTYYL